MAFLEEETKRVLWSTLRDTLSYLFSTVPAFLLGWLVAEIERSKPMLEMALALNSYKFISTWAGGMIFAQISILIWFVLFVLLIIRHSLNRYTGRSNWSQLKRKLKFILNPIATFGAFGLGIVLVNHIPFAIVWVFYFFIMVISLPLLANINSEADKRLAGAI